MKPIHRASLRSISAWLVALGVLMTPSETPAQTLRVSTYGLDSNSGLTWSSSLRTLQSALARADADPSISRIEIAAGIYKPGGSRFSTFTLVENVTLVGGYPPAGGTVPEPDVYETILSGDIGVHGSAADNCYTVLTALGITNVRLEGLHIRAGYSDHTSASPGPAGFGGGLYAQNSGIVILNCRFHANRAIQGGAAYLLGGATTFYGCRFTQNLAGDFGGAIATVPGLNDNELLVDRSWFLGNLAGVSGGAVYAGFQHGIYNSIFSGNASGTAGGAVLVDFGGGDSRVGNCTFANNRAGLGGAAYVSFSLGSTDVANSIFWSNTPADTSVAFAPGSIYSVHHCVLPPEPMPWCVATSSIYVDPEFVDELGSDGVAGTADDNPRIGRGSPCVNAGLNDSVPTYAEQDIDGRVRISAPMPRLPAIVDIGANELVPLL
ncbi:MAG: right-handed parallel beta-helix repeat-containing protein [Planctomycetota bacterium]